MRKLILVRHSLPEIVQDVPADKWRLSEEGRLRCGPLADTISNYEPSVIVASIEPKALETAEIVAHRLGTRLEQACGLHEHERDNVGFFPTEELFEEAVAALFDQPNELVLGRETATQARERFAQAVENVLAIYPVGNVVIVAHGTVIALFVSAHAAVKPYEFWRRLAAPSCVVLSVPEMSLLATVGDIAVQT